MIKLKNRNRYKRQNQKTIWSKDIEKAKILRTTNEKQTNRNGLGLCTLFCSSNSISDFYADVIFVCSVKNQPSGDSVVSIRGAKEETEGKKELEEKQNNEVDAKKKIEYQKFG